MNMKKKLILLPCLLLLFLDTYSQDFLQYDRDVANIASQINVSISDENLCEDFIRLLDNIESDIEEILEENKSLPTDVIRSLKKTKAQSDALAAFLRAISAASNGGFISRKQLGYVTEMVEFSIFEIYSEKYCINLFEIRVGLFKAIIAQQKESDKDLKIVAYIKSKGGLSSTKMEAGLAFSEYRQIWSNEDDLNNSDYEVTKIECTYLKGF